MIVASNVLGSGKEGKKEVRKGRKEGKEEGIQIGSRDSDEI